MILSAAASLAAGAAAGAVARLFLAGGVATLSWMTSLSETAKRSAGLAALALAGVLAFFEPGRALAAAAWFGAAAFFATIFFGSKAGYLACGAYALGLIAYGAFAPGGADGEPGGRFAFAAASLEALGLFALSCMALSRTVAALRGAEKAVAKLGAELRNREFELKRETAGRLDAEERADFFANFDDISGLPNEHRFVETAERYISIARARGRTLALMALGLDRFKRVREVRGAAFTDAILREAADRLRRSFREDDFIARSGWDGFVLLLPDVRDHEDLRGIIKKVRAAFDRSFRVDSSDVGLSASFGLALSPHDGTTAESLLRAAETAMHQAIDAGPGSYRLYDAAMHARLLESQRLEEEMSDAIKTCSFDPWFQPKVDKGGLIVGAEALARWNLGDGRFRPPSDFIQAAEKTGRIDDIGRIVLSKACERAAAWERMGLRPIPVSVNLSPYQFKSDLLVREIRAILADSRLSPSRLDIEITESGIMEDPAATVEKLAELKALGCSISIDDFGTGYASFATLRDYPVDTVKLPQSFVKPLPEDGRSSLIAAAVIELAHSLSYSVVAEGVETPAQLEWLDRAMCDHYQGYLFAPPLPEAEFEAELLGVGRATLN